MCTVPVSFCSEYCCVWAASASYNFNSLHSHAGRCLRNIFSHLVRSPLLVGLLMQTQQKPGCKHSCWDVSKHHQHLLSFLISHGKIITCRAKINDLIIKIWIFLKKDHWEWVYLKGWTPSYIISVNINCYSFFAWHGGSRYGNFLGVDATWS